MGDIVAGIVKAIQKPLGFEIFNLGSCQPQTIAKLVEIISAALGKTAKFVWGSLPAGDVPLTHANIDKARRLLGWVAKTNLETGIQNLIAWYKTNSAL